MVPSKDPRITGRSLEPQTQHRSPVPRLPPQGGWGCPFGRTHENFPEEPHCCPSCQPASLLHRTPLGQPQTRRALPLPPAPGEGLHTHRPQGSIHLPPAPGLAGPEVNGGTGAGRRRPTYWGYSRPTAAKLPASPMGPGPSDTTQATHNMGGGRDSRGGGRGHAHCHTQRGTRMLTGKGFRSQHVAKAPSPSET